MFPLRLVIGGAPKAGTSALFTSLAAHPDLLPSAPKETHYLLEPEHPLVAGRPCWATHGWREYRRFFRGAEISRRACFEGSTHYLYSATARRALKSLEDRPFAVFLLREPAARIHSSFYYTKYNLAAVAGGFSFSDYVDRLLEGHGDAIARLVTRPASAYVLPRELEYSRYVEHLLAWRDALGSHRVLVFLFEDWIRDPAAVTRRICAALQIAPAPIRKSGERNETYRVHRLGIHRVARRVAPLLPQGWVKRTTRELYLRLQRAGGRRVDRGDQEAVARLRAYFEAYNRSLSDQFGVDTAAWRAGP